MLRLTMVLIGCVVILAAASGVAFAQVATQWSETQMDNGYVVFGYTTLENLPANYVPKRAEATNKVSCALAKGQYQSVQFGVYALDEGVNKIKATVTCDIPVTIYHRIDPDIKAKLGQAPEEIYTWMGPEVYLQRGDTYPSLAKGTSVGFWLTFKAPDNARPGVHKGKIVVEAEGRPATEIALTITVRPFELERAKAAFGMYYREDFMPARLGSWGASDKLESAIFADMAAHGQNGVTFYQFGDFTTLPPKASMPVERTFALARAAGLTHPDIPSMFLMHNITAGEHGVSASQMRAAVDWLNSEAKKQQWPGIVLYTQDEPAYPSPGLREGFGPVARHRIRTGTALNATGVYGYGDIHSVWIPIGGDITPEMQAEAKRQGAQVWTYSYRIWREGFIPLRQRYYAGLYTWGLNLGGNYVWAYSHGHHGHAWFMPGAEEPMPITGWEARRDGVDDYRYLQTLESSIAAKPGNPTAIQAAAWLKSLRDKIKSFDPHLAVAGKPFTIKDYEAIRVKASGYIEKLGLAPAAKFRTLPATYVKDEAAPFRGKSVEQCRQALQSSSVSRQRGAAAALFEMGAKAAPAVGDLAAALDNPGARIPVLRAIEAIGPDAYPALPGLESLLSNKDEFVRLSATFALVGISRPDSWTTELRGYDPADVSPRAAELVPLLRKALADTFPQVSDAAAFGLYYCGPASIDALPYAIEAVEKKSNVEASTKIIAGLGPKAAPAVPALIKQIDAAKGNDPYNCQAIASIGEAASEAIPTLEKYKTWDNPYLADVLYALICIRGDQKDLEMLVDMMGKENLPQGPWQWHIAGKFLGALGGKAAPVAGQLREKLPLLGKEPTLKQQMETLYLPRITRNAKPLRLLPR